MLLARRDIQYKRILHVIVLCLSVVFPVWAGNPMPFYGADPEPLQGPDGRMYIFPTNSGPEGGSVRDWHCYSSANLVDWTDHGQIIDVDDVAWAHSKAWAPCAAYRNGRFYFYYYFFDATPKASVGVCSSADPNGPWTDHSVEAPLTSRLHDPAVFIDENGQAYIFNSSRYKKLNPDMISTTGDYIEFSYGPSPYRTNEEAAFIFTRKGKYYMTQSPSTKHGSGRPEAVVYYTSDSFTGPWTYGGRIMDPVRNLSRHASGYAFHGIYMLWYHTLENDQFHRRRPCADYLKFNEDGTIQKVIPSSEGVIYQEPKHSKGYNETKEAHRLRNLRERSEAGQGLPPLADRLAGIASHDRAVHVLDIWIRDPFVFIGDDGAYYLTGTTIDTEPDGVIGIPLWRSDNLAAWEKLPRLWTLSDSSWMGSVKPKRHANPNLLVWAPEIYQFGNRWVMMHTTNANTANLLVSRNENLQGTFDEPMQADFGARHDPFLFNEDGPPWLVWGCTYIAPMKDDFTGFTGEPIVIGPSNRHMGHEGSSIMKIGSRYVLFGTAWSTDSIRKGTYNLYYCTSDKLEGPYDERKFAGRFLGHGTPFQDKKGRWWCTAFFNANHPTASLADTHNLAKVKADAYTINKMGVTLVPLDIKTDGHGNIIVRAKDRRYVKPGPEEAQVF